MHAWECVAHGGDTRPRPRSRSFWVIGCAVAITVLARLPLLGLPAWADEAGFLTVGGGWRLGDSPGDLSLYDAYWVDRPPVLITLFGFAERLGGLVALRLLGALAAAVTVVCVAWIANSVAGPRAAKWAAVTGAALLCTPFHWSFMVDAELVSAPFLAAGIGCVISGIASDGRRGLLLSAAGGAMAVAAILTKQNMADVFVFMAALVPIGLLLRSISFQTAARHSGAFVAGMIGFGAVVAAWTLAHGTSLGSVYYAMYPFRLDAERVDQDLLERDGGHGDRGTPQRSVAADRVGGDLGRTTAQPGCLRPRPAGRSRL